MSEFKEWISLYFTRYEIENEVGGYQQKKTQSLQSENKRLRKAAEIGLEIGEFYGDYNWKCSTPPFYDQGNFMDDPNDYGSKGGIVQLQVFWQISPNQDTRNKGVIEVNKTKRNKKS